VLIQSVSQPDLHLFDREIERTTTPALLFKTL
jgi:hypothetical protein